MKGILKKVGTAVLALSLFSGAAAATMTACNFFGQEEDPNPGIVNPVDPDDNKEPDDPVIIEPDDPDDEKDPEENPDEKPDEKPDDEKEPDKDPDDEQNPDENPDKDPDENPDDEKDPDDEQGPEKPTRDELLEAEDAIEGYKLNNSGDDFVRDENGNPIKFFKTDEIYDTVMERLDKPATATITTPLKYGYYGEYSSVDVLCANYNSSEKTYTIISLCEYEKTGLENPKTLSVVTFPMDIDAADKKFSKLEEQIAEWKPKNIEDERFDYKVSNLDYDKEEYFTIDVDQDDKEFLDKCVDLAYLDDQKPQNALILFQNRSEEFPAFDIGSHIKIDIKIITFDDSEILIDNREVRSSSVIGDGWVRNIMNYEKDQEEGHTYVVMLENGSKTITNVDKIEYNENLIEDIKDANQKSKNSSREL